MKETTKEQIIKTALKIMSDEGISGITIRKISESAQVNIAAVNYHFRSKKMLMEEAIGYFIDELEKVYSVLVDANDPKAGLKEFLNAFVGFTLSYPGVVHGLFVQLIQPTQSSPQLERSMSQNFELLKENIRQITDITESRKLDFVALEIMSAVTYPVLIGGHLKKIALLDYGNIKDREEYISLLIDSL
jgi:TetR/AcrR family transcriptional regulator, regulator of cefoperazone and chloramphenicol sensitivity